MITFSDGPAIGVGLMLRRAPLLMRVVFDPLTKKWDALDQLTDQPATREQIHVYLRGPGEPGFACYDFKRGDGCMSVLAVYSYFDPQPSDSEMRSTANWRAWARAHMPKTTAEK